MKINEILTEDIEQLDELNWKKAAAAATLAGAGLFGGGQAADASSITNDPYVMAQFQKQIMADEIKKIMAAFEEQDVLKLSYLIGLLEPYYENNLLSERGEQEFLADVGTLKKLKSIVPSRSDVDNMQKRGYKESDRAIKSGETNPKKVLEQFKDFSNEIQKKKNTPKQMRYVSKDIDQNIKRTVDNDGEITELVKNHPYFKSIIRFYSGPLTYEKDDKEYGFPTRNKIGQIYNTVTKTISVGTNTSVDDNLGLFKGKGYIIIADGTKIEGEWKPLSGKEFKHSILIPKNKSDISKLDSSEQKDIQKYYDKTSQVTQTTNINVAPQSKSGIKTINYTNPNSSVKMYQGEVNSTGKPHGIGKITFSNGSVIETRFSDNGIVFGEKTTLYKNGQTFSGTMEKNKDGRSYFKPSEKDSERYKLTKK